MSINKTTFAISSYSTSDLINIGTPLSVSYLIDEKYTIDNTNGVIYPNSAVVHKNVYDLVSKIDDLLTNTTEQPVYTEWNWANWYGAGSLVYTYDNATLDYKFYKAAKMTNPLITLDNTTYWNDFVSPVWSIAGGETYVKGSVVHVITEGTYSFYESLKDVIIDIDINNIEYWRPLNLEAWLYDKRYNIGTKVYSENVVYTTIKTILPVTKIDNTSYWTPYFNYYALINIAGIVSVELENSLEILSGHITDLKNLFELDTTGKSDAEMLEIYDSMYNLNVTIQSDWVSAETTYNNMTKEVTSTYSLLWKNMYDANIYITELNLYTVDPMRVLESIKYLDSFQELLASTESKSIVAYVSNLYVQQDPAQKNGAYFVYDINRSRFIKALVGQHDHRNKAILDEISQSYDELSDTDNTSNKVLTIRKEIAEGTSDLQWEFHAQWTDIDLMPDKPTDGKEYILKLDDAGLLQWTDKITSSIAFIKKEKEILADGIEVEFDVELSFDNEGVPTDSMMLFKNSLYISSYTWEYDANAKILNITLTNGETFNTDDFVTVILIRNTSAEMLSKLSDQYVSKKEAVEILSNGSISLRDYVKKETLSKYSLRNHIHTRYASLDHSHWGVYADYYHNHDGLYMTRDNVNQTLANILSINPDLVNIISTIASDLETLNSTFVSKVVYDQYIALTDQRLDDLEVVDENSLFINPSTGEVSKKTGISTFEAVDIKSFQVQTKYKVSDLPGETEVYNLEDWLDHVLDLISTEELRIKQVYQTTMKADKVIRAYVLSSGDADLVIDDFTIISAKLKINTPFENPISIYIDETILIDSAEITEDTISFTNYDIYEVINIEKTISFNLVSGDSGDAILIITGFAI